MRPHDWAFSAAIGGAVLAVVAIFRGDLAWALVWVVVAGGAGLAARVCSRRYPGPMPYVLRWLLLLPRGPHSPEHLHRILEPKSGERMLEIGPGIGTHALPVASSLAPSGVLDVLDVQQEMLDDLMRRAAEAGITNIVATQGDAQKLRYPDHTFDAAYLMTVLGEIPDEHAALRELRRVLKPTGRLVVGEIIIDPDFVSLRVLREQTERAGFAFARRLGSSMSYLARFEPSVSEDGVVT